MVKAFFSTLLILISFSSAFADSTLIAQAHKEYQELKGKPLPTASDAQVSGVLSLKDPKKEVQTREWNYILGIKAQAFQPRGIVKNDLGETFNLNSRGTTFMPTLELGAQTSAWNLGAVNLKVVGSGDISYANQQTSVSLASGFRISETYLNVIEMSGGLGLQLSWQELNSLFAEFEYRIGELNYTQASTNDFANFSEAGQIQKLSTRLLWQVGNSLHLSLGLSQNEILNNSAIDVETTRYDIGTRFIW